MSCGIIYTGLSRIECCYESGGILWILDIELHFGGFIIAHFCYMQIISTCSTQYFVSPLFKSWIWSGWSQISTPLCGGGSLWRLFSCLTCFQGSSSLVVLFASSSGYSSGSFTSIARNVPLNNQWMVESTQVSSRHGSYYCPEWSLKSRMSPKSKQSDACSHWWILYASEAPRKENLSVRAVSFACSFSVNSVSIRCAFHLDIWTSGSQLARFNSYNC